jgi:hypothetical protein
MTVLSMHFISLLAATAILCALPFLLQYMLREFSGFSRFQPKKRRNGPKAYPLVGAMLEHLWHWDNIHDWLTSYYEKYHTWEAPMHLNKIVYYTVDVENVKYILKTNFSNFPKVCLWISPDVLQCATQVHESQSPRMRTKHFGIVTWQSDNSHWEKWVLMDVNCPP